MLNLTTPTPSTQTPTRLTGLPLWIARAAWLILVTLHLVLFYLSLPFLHLAAPYTGPGWPLAIQKLGLTMGMLDTYQLVLQTLTVVSCTLVAVLAVWRRSDDWMVLAVSLMLVSFAVVVSSEAAFVVPSVYPSLRLGSNFLTAFGMNSLLWMMYLMPDGRFVPRWSPIPALAWAIWTFTGIFGLSTIPWGMPFREFLLLQVLVFGSGGAAQVYRYLKVSTQVQRQQTKWMLLGILLVFAGFVISSLVLANRTAYIPGVPALLAHLLIERPAFILPRLLLPVFISIAMLRYRLWDIDFILNRSMVYGALTLLLAVMFGGSLWAISRLFQGFEGGTLVAVTVSAAAFGAVFQPARRRLQRFVDRRFYQIHVDYLKTPPAGLKARAAETGQFPHTSLGEFQDLEPIGRGGMAEVYRATHPTQDFPVAIKVLPASLAADPQFQHRFQREAQVISSLNHPNIVRLFDYGDEDGLFYMVMEYLPGQDLGNLLKENRRLPLDEALPLLGQIASALDYAHASGLVHRDVKPSNIRVIPGFLNPFERVVLMDFGIAKIIGGETGMTHTSMLGTLDYIAPEQIKASDQVDGKADQYSFAVLIYQVLTGELPFKRSNPGALLLAHLQQPPPDPRSLLPDLPSEAAHALLRALAKDPESRFPSAGEFVQALAARES
jgi:serine/threonine-protein kinase